jgi:hypothetical protein
VRDAHDAVLVAREVFFRDQDRVGLQAGWDSESLLRVEVFEKPENVEKGAGKIAEFQISLPDR